MEHPLHRMRSWRHRPALRSRRLLLGLGLFGWLLPAAGCGPAIRPANCNFGPAQEVVANGIQALGGLERWQSVGAIQARAIVTMYDEQGTAVVHEQQQVISPRAGELVATAALPNGKYRIRVSSAGRAEFQGPPGLLSPELKGRLLSAMQMTLHRVRGPYNLCLGERAGRPENAAIEGRSLTRVPVAGGVQDIRAYYFDPRNRLLTYATAGGDMAGQSGTVTRYAWEFPGNGLAFPSGIGVVRIGQDVLLGQAKVLDVAYHNVRIAQNRRNGV